MTVAGIISSIPRTQHIIRNAVRRKVLVLEIEKDQRIAELEDRIHTLEFQLRLAQKRRWWQR